MAASIRSILLDRVSGYFVLVVLFAAGLPVLLHVLPDVHQRYGLILLLGVSVSGLIALFLIDYLPRGLLRFRLVAELAALSPPGRRLSGRPAPSTVPPASPPAPHRLETRGRPSVIG